MKGKFTLISILLLLMFSVGQVKAQWLIYTGDTVPDQEEVIAAGELDFTTLSDEAPGADMVDTCMPDPDFAGNRIFHYEQLEAASTLCYRSDFSDIGFTTDSVFTVVVRMKGAGYGADTLGIGMEIRNGAAGTRAKFTIEPAANLISLDTFDLDVSQDTVTNGIGLVAKLNLDLDEWHIYRIAVDGDNYSVYIDEWARPIIKGVTSGTTANQYIKFGDSGGDIYAGYIDYILLDTSGAWGPSAGGDNNPDGPVLPAALRDIPAPACVASWEFDGDLTDAVGGLTLTAYGGGDAYVTALTDEALDLTVNDTVKGILAIGDAEDLMFGINSFSVVSIVQAPIVGVDAAIANEQFPILFGQFGSNLTSNIHPAEGVRYGLHMKGTQTRFTIDDDGAKVQVDGQSERLWKRGDYNLVVGVRDVEADTVRVYLNGVQIGTRRDRCGTMMPIDMPLIIGGVGHDNGSRLEGQIDKVEIYNYALTPAEIEAMWNALPSQDPEPVSHWDFNEEGVGVDTVADIVGGATGELIGDKLVFVEGMNGNAVDFTQSADTTVIYVPAEKIEHLVFDSASFTVSALAKIDPTTDPNQINLLIFGCTGTATDIKTGETIGNGNWYALTTKAGHVRWTIDDAIEKTQAGTDDGAIRTELNFEYPLQQWAHIVGIRSVEDTSMTVYVNGVKVRYVENILTLKMDLDSVPILIGNWHSGLNPTDGIIDDIQIFDTALTEADVHNLYNDLAFDIVINKPPSCDFEISPEVDTVTYENTATDATYTLSESATFALNGEAADADTLPFNTLTLMYQVSINAPDTLYAATFTDADKDTASVTLDTALTDGYVLTIEFIADDGQHKVTATMDVKVVLKTINNFIDGTKQIMASDGDKFLAYPSIANNFITIATSDDFVSQQVSFVNMSGNLVKQEILTAKETLIDISDLPAGVYGISLNGFSTKIIVNR